MSVLELHDVTKHFATGDQVICALKGITLAVEPGELIAVYGPSGSGKSTLLLVAAGMVAPDAGSVRVAGTDISALSAAESAHLAQTEIGFVFQSFNLLQGATAADNAAFPLLAGRMSLDEARRRAAPWLDRVGLRRRLTHFPAQLSGGERQRVAIARALVHEPKLILADEPTGSLDTENGRLVLELLAEICRERQAAGVVVTHDPAAASIADRVLDLRDGMLSAHPLDIPLAVQARIDADARRERSV